MKLKKNQLLLLILVGILGAGMLLIKNFNIIGHCHDGGTSRAVYVSGSYAYVVDMYDGLEIIYISDPTRPVKVGQFDDDGIASSSHTDGSYSHDVYVSGSYAYVADGDDGLEIIDISDPTTPVEVGQFDSRSGSRGIYVSGSYAYLANRWDGLEIIDISDPTTPVKVGQFNDSGQALGVYVSGSYAYVADGDDGLEIIDITDPTAPLEVGQFNNSGSAEDVFVLGSYAYVADYKDGLYIIDITDPTAPLEVGQFCDGSYAQDVYVSGSYAYIAYGIFSGLKIIDISDPTDPVKVELFDDYIENAHDTYVSDSYVYVAGKDGLEIIDLWSPKEKISNIILWSIIGILTLLALVDLGYLIKEEVKFLKTEPKIKREVYMVGKKVFLFSSIAPALYIIYFLAFLLPTEIKHGYISDEIYIFLIVSWSVVIFAFTIPAMIGKRLLFTEHKKRIFLMPVMTFVICIILCIILYNSLRNTSLFYDLGFAIFIIPILVIIVLILTGISTFIASSLSK